MQFLGDQKQPFQSLLLRKKEPIEIKAATIKTFNVKSSQASMNSSKRVFNFF